MKWQYLIAVCLLDAFMGPVTVADQPARRSPKEGLQAFNHLIGEWKGTGRPEGSREEQDRGLWIETQDWIWRFKGADVWLQVRFTKCKHFVRGELRYLPDKDVYQFTLYTPAKDTLTFTGKLTDRRLTLERSDGQKKEDQRLVVSLLHPNRFLYAYEVKPADRSLFTRVYRVGATKKGVPFASSGDNQPECVVSGGLGTIRVSYKGKTYYVCCTGCQAEFKANPDKYVKEYEAKKARQGK
jgi:hypothetical protein